jgi:glycosyltransferase involved in cell wall biosynthesis
VTQPSPRVAILTSAHAPFDPRIFDKQGRTLAAAGFDVHLVVPHDRDEMVDGVRIHGIPRAPTRLRRMTAGPLRVLREALRLRADAYHFHDPELIPVGLVLKAMGKRVIYDAHEDLPKSILGKGYLPGWLVAPLSRVVGMVERAAARTFDLAVLARDDIAGSFQGSGRSLLIRNFPKREVFTGRARVGRSDGDFVVVYVGGLTVGRGAIQLIEALALVSERCRPRLIIYGKFTPPELEQQVRSMPGYARVDYRGWIDHRLMPEELARADAGVVCFLPEPNNINAGPTKLFEYMAAGLPVVASRFPLWREVVEGKDSGLTVDPSDPRAIAAALEFLADHPDRAAAMGANGRRAVLTEYNWEAEGERLVRAYRELLASSR